MAELVTQSLQGFDGITGARSVNFRRINKKSGIFCCRPQHHLQTLLRRNLRYTAMRWPTRRNPAHSGKAKMAYRFFGQAQVSKVYRVKSATKEA